MSNTDILQDVNIDEDNWVINIIPREINILVIFNMTETYKEL